MSDGKEIVKSGEEKHIKEHNSFFQILGVINAEDNKIKVELDWDKPFIKYLKEKGYNGSNDDEVIQLYLLTLIKVISSDLNVDGYE